MKTIISEVICRYYFLQFLHSQTRLIMTDYISFIHFDGNCINVIKIDEIKIESQSNLVDFNRFATLWVIMYRLIH
jgi:hypothetical protein